VFVTCGQSFDSAFAQARGSYARLMLHISTAKGYGAPEEITLEVSPKSWRRILAWPGQRDRAGWRAAPFRLFAEMNQANNA
jgi:hypothetical protein